MRRVILSGIKLRHFILSLISFLVLISCGGTDNITVNPRPIASDGGTAKEREMAGLIRGHPKQKRRTLLYNTRLTLVARARAWSGGSPGIAQSTARRLSSSSCASEPRLCGGSSISIRLIEPPHTP